MARSALNQKKRQWLDNECYVVEPSVFGGASALSFYTIIFGLIYYAVMRGNDIKDLCMLSSVMPIATTKLFPTTNSNISLSTTLVGLGIKLNPSLNHTKQSKTIATAHLELHFLLNTYYYTHFI